MPFYAFEFNVPAGTTEDNPYTLERQLTSGQLNRLRVVIPNGHQGLARLRIEHREGPLLPTLGSDPPWIRGDGSQIDMEPRIKLPGPEWLVRFVGWNEDVTYDHAFIIYMD